MRILMVSDVYFPRVNGVSTSIQAFRQALTAAGHHVTLIAPDYGQTVEDEVGIIRISSRNVIVDPEDRI
ncbi:glycosyltransferase [Thiothrix nivea]|uniref:Glycosyl transferase group 1 n=1 Tax=Thiothrix nivea (strain ATCC 35100 / DSM 5205 / JP2) TaxID=870187 RepID=A0A656HE24_THINJ|nr:glycosyltransferase [Thiothrix nivea]EIJ33680.1 glycosyl transferase group 1 [Thiothrix nivea DSM 5205]